MTAQELKLMGGQVQNRTQQIAQGNGIWSCFWSGGDGWEKASGGD